MSTSFRCLVVGSDGVIGKALLDHLNQHVLQALGTTRRMPVDAQHILLDLTQHLDSFVIPPTVHIVVNCAAVSRLEACQRDPVGSRRVNVDSVVALAEKCRQQGIFFIHLSSDKVFSGQIPHLPADAPFAPTTEYGRQKADAERYLLKLQSEGLSLAIIRLTKVLTRDVTLFRNWRDALLRGEVIRPFADMTLAPVPITLAIEVISRVAEGGHRGIFQLSADRDVSYAEVAQRLVALMEADSDLVRPVSASQSRLFEETISPYTSLDCTNTRDRLQIELPAIWSTVDWAFRPLLLQTL